MFHHTLPLFTLPFSVPSVFFLVLTILAWAAISGNLEEEKNMSLSTSQHFLTALPPAFLFGFSSVYYVVPATWKVVFGVLPVWANRGVFWDIMQMMGAIIFTVSSVAWIALLNKRQS